MVKIAVFEDEKNQFSKLLRGELEKRGMDKGACVQSACKESAHSCGQFEIAVWMSTREAEGEGAQKIPVQALIAESEQAHQALKTVRPEAIITIGFGKRDTITPSSTMLHEKGLATLQREIVCLSGSLVTPQELPLDDVPGSMLEKMAISAVILLCQTE